MPKIVDKYRLDTVIGSGQFGKVYKGVNLQTNEVFAIKAIKREIYDETPKLKGFVVNEIQSLSRINNENVVKFIEMITTLNHVYFVYEFCNGGTLEELIFSRGYLSEEESLQIFRQIINGLYSVVQLNIIHRDLKPQNIIFNNGVSKIADFGFCKPLQSRKDLSKTILGSPIYMAPEILLREEYSMKADIWSLGVLLYEMLYGKCPFEGKNISQLINLIKENDLKFPPEFKVSQATNNLICKMLCKDPLKRIDWEGIWDFLQKPAPTLAGSEGEMLKIKLETKKEIGSPSYAVDTKAKQIQYYTPTNQDENLGKVNTFVKSRDATPSVSTINPTSYSKANKIEYVESSFSGSLNPNPSIVTNKISTPVSTPQTTITPKVPQTGMQTFTQVASQIGPTNTAQGSQINPTQISFTISQPGQIISNQISSSSQTNTNQGNQGNTNQNQTGQNLNQSSLSNNQSNISSFPAGLKNNEASISQSNPNNKSNQNSHRNSQNNLSPNQVAQNNTQSSEINQNTQMFIPISQNISNKPNSQAINPTPSPKKIINMPENNQTTNLSQANPSQIMSYGLKANEDEELFRSKSKTVFCQPFTYFKHNFDQHFKIRIEKPIKDKEGFFLFLNREILKIYYISQVFSNVHIYKLAQEFASFEYLFLKYLYSHTRRVKELMLDKIDYDVSTKISNVVELVKLPEYGQFEKEIKFQLEKIVALMMHQKKAFLLNHQNLEESELENDNVFNFRRFLFMMFDYIEKIKNDFHYSSDEKFKAPDANKYIIFLNELIDSILIDELFNKFITESGTLDSQKYFEDIKKSSIDGILKIVAQKIEFAKSKFKF